MMSPLYLLLILILLLCSRLYLNWLRLSQVPGPLLASITDFWRAYYQFNGKLRNKTVELHKRYGPIVRYGVRSVSINNPSVVDVIYTSRVGFTIADSYQVLVGISKGKEVHSLVTIKDENRHGALRRSIAGAFSPTGALDYEAYIDQTIEELLDVLSLKSSVDLSSTMLYYTMDAAGRFTFNTPIGCLAANSDVGGSIQVIRERFHHWGWWSSVPWLERVVCRNPIAIRMNRTPSSMVATAASKLRQREGKIDDSAAHPPDLLTKFLESSKAHPDVLSSAGIVGMLMSTISGNSDTTATTLTAIIFQLIKHPEALARLEDELTNATLDKPVPAFNQVNKLPFLNAVIKETMRLFSTPTWPIERRVPAGGLTFGGVTLPEGTSVGVLPSALHLNPDVFGPDAETYRPERWLIADTDKLRVMEASHLGFSRGRRVCLGQHIAVLQMKKVIPALVSTFKITLDDPNAELNADWSGAIPCLKPLNVRIERKVSADIANLF